MYHTEAFAVCENYSPPEGFNPKDLHRLLKKIGSPSGGDDLGKHPKTILLSQYNCTNLSRNRILVKKMSLTLVGKIVALADCSSGWLEGPNKVYIPFLACGDLSGYDSDRSYPLPKVADGTYQSLDPVQPPIAPPYKRALELKKASSHGIRELENLTLEP